jgi:methylase of polypeptide subunit release factors
MALPDIDRLRSLDDTTLHELRARLVEVNFTSELLAFVEPIAAGFLDPLRLCLVRDALTREGSPGSQLGRLFLYSDAVARPTVEEALGSSLMRVAVETGLVVDAPGDEGLVRSPFQLTPLDGLYFLADTLDAGGETVMGPGQTTLPLIRLAERLPGASALDVGCGAGSIALFAARRGLRALGTDVNPRAIALARWNARLNGVAAEFEVGDLTAPARGQRFDLVFSQPPFVMRPPEMDAVTFLHGGAWGDELALALFVQLPSVLAPAGTAAVLLDTAWRPDAPFHQRVRAALGGAPLDLLVLLAKGMNPDAHAIAHAQLEDLTLGPRFAKDAVRYRRHLTDLGVTRIHHGLVLLHASAEGSEKSRYSIQLLVRSLGALRSEMVATILSALDLAACPDDALLPCAVSWTEGTTWIEERTGPDPELEPTCRLRFPPSSPFLDLEVPETSFTLFEILGRAPSIEEGIGLYAEACSCAPEEVRAEVLRFVREGLSRGALRPRSG